ncbi:MAG TPA: hypothetical protein VF247_03350 [Candidatus Krumholzibacteria bacterium]
MRLKLGLALLMVVAGVTAAHAGRLFGDVKKGDKPVEGLLITLQAVSAKPEDKGAATGPIDSVITDKVGSYKVMVKGEGKYSLSVYQGKQTARLEVFSYKEPTRYDLVLEEKEGKLTVRRK